MRASRGERPRRMPVGRGRSRSSKRLSAPSPRRIWRSRSLKLAASVISPVRGVRVTSIVSFFWGDGTPHLARVKAAGAVAIQAAGSVAEAKRAADAGFDLIVAQGHRDPAAMEKDLLLNAAGFRVRRYLRALLGRHLAK